MLEHLPLDFYLKELEIINKMLDLDHRNFHGWDYRRFVVFKANINLLDEFNYTTLKINQNFSNFSAWHYRGFLLEKVFFDQQLQEQKMKDLDLITNAIFTEPDGMFSTYHRSISLALSPVPFRKQYKKD